MVSWPNKREFARYELRRPDFRRRAWRRWRGIASEGTQEWWAEIAFRIKRLDIQNRIMRHLTNKMLESFKETPLIPPPTGKTVRFVRYQPPGKV